MGLATSGYSLGFMILPVTLHWLITTLTWREALIINAGLMLHACIFAALLLPVELFQEPGHRKKILTKSPRSSAWYDVISIEIFKKPAFYVQMLNNCMYCIGLAPVTMLLPEYSHWCGMSKAQGSMLLSMVYVGSFIGRILAAFVMNHFPGVDRLHIHNVSTVLGGVIMALYPLKETFAMFAPITTMVGLMYGVLWASLPVVTRELYGAELLTNSLSYMMIADGMGLLVGPPIAG